MGRSPHARLASETTVPVPNGSVVDGHRFQARARLADRLESSDDSLVLWDGAGPATRAVLVEVTVAGAAPGRGSLVVRGCTVSLRLYHAERRGRALAWDGLAVPCAPDTTRVTLPAGRPARFEERVEFWRFPAGAVPPGRYRAHATFRLSHSTLEIPTGVLDLSFGLEDLRYRAAVRLTDGSVEVVAVVRNAGARPVALAYGACALRIRAYRAGGPSTHPSWKSELRTAPGGVGYGCPAYSTTAAVPPGGELSPSEFRAQVPISEILGDSLASGAYRFTAVLELNFGETAEFAAGGTSISLSR